MTPARIRINSTIPGEILIGSGVPADDQAGYLLRIEIIIDTRKRYTLLFINFKLLQTGVYHKRNKTKCRVIRSNYDALYMHYNRCRQGIWGVFASLTTKHGKG